MQRARTRYKIIVIKSQGQYSLRLDQSAVREVIAVYKFIYDAFDPKINKPDNAKNLLAWIFSRRKNWQISRMLADSNEIRVAGLLARNESEPVRARGKNAGTSVLKRPSKT